MNLFKKRFPTALNAPAQLFIRYSLSFLLLLFFFRIVGYFHLNATQTLPQGGFSLQLIGFWFDILFWLKVSAILIIPFYLLSRLGNKTAIVFYRVITGLLLLGYFALLKYFSVSLVPLGADLFGYTTDELSHTIGAGGGLSLLTIIPVVLIFALLVLVPKIFGKTHYGDEFLWIFTIAIISSLFIKTLPNENEYDSDLKYYLTNNKLSYFLTKSYNYFSDDEENEDYNSYYLDDDTTNATAIKYVDPNFPFLHQTAKNDVLGNFFTLNKSQKPNLVFLVIESLGAAYSGQEAYLGSFTPFIDSLSKKSISFTNFLSTSGRTFGMLSGLFGSLPFGNKGFLELGERMPQHASLFSILKKQGYSTGFYYGGNAHFDNMDIFLRKQAIDRLVQEKDFGNGYQKLPSNSNGFTWGYGDKDIFKKYLTDVKPESGPRLDVFLTVATHNPFQIHNQDVYLKKFDDRLNALKLDETQKKEYAKYRKQYSTLLYMDDAVKYFFSEYAKRPDFNNTIFVITGDHRMPEIPVSTKIDRFHVPFNIYSPLLKRTATIHSVSSHFDVTPSFIELLRKPYSMLLPSTATWLGTGIDTVRAFRNIHSLPIMRNKNEILDYVAGDYFVAGNELFQLADRFKIEPTNDASKLREVQSKFADFKVRNQKAVNGNKLLPDSLVGYTSYRK